MMDYKMLINEIQAHNKDLIEQVKEKNAELQRLREENERYKKALEFYADKENYNRLFVPPTIDKNGYYKESLILSDGGEQAIQALKGELK